MNVGYQLGKPLTTVVDMGKAVPNSMYKIYGTTKSDLAKMHSAFVKILAAQIATINWMDTLANYEKVATLATVVGDSPDVMRQAMADYRQMGFLTVGNAALPRLNIEKTIKAQIAAGNVPAAKAPSDGQIINLSLYAEAALVK